MSTYQSKKRKRDVVVVHQNGVDTSRPTAVFKPTAGRKHTLSIALPGSIIANAQTPDQKTALAAHIGRACAVFCVDEVVIFNDGESLKPQQQQRRTSGRDYQAEDEASGYTGYTDPDDFLYHVMSYLETPPHLRRLLFPMHPNLKNAGAMASLDMPHHMKANEWCQYREGVTVATVAPEHSSKKKKRQSDADMPGDFTLVECGLPGRARIPVSLPADTRVTIKFKSAEEPPMDGYSAVAAQAVSPDAPREEAGYYWGYSCRKAASLSAVFTESPYPEGYDISIGTSERGMPVGELVRKEGEATSAIPRSWQHMLLVFGGVAGLETALKADQALLSKGVTEVKELFDHWVNLVPGQGSRTIRTEEAVWLGLMGLRQVIVERQE